MRVRVNDQERSFRLEKENLTVPFLLLGENGVTSNQAISQKILHETEDEIEGFWGH